MKTSEVFNLVNAIERLATAYATFTTPHTGSRAPDGYEVSGILKAANDLASQIPPLASQTDDIPF